VAPQARLVTAGRVGKPHGLDGSFAVAEPQVPLSEGAEVTLAGVSRTIERRAGTDERPLVRLAGVASRAEATALRGESLYVSEEDAPLADDEWLAADLLGCRIEGLGEVIGVVGGPSCEVLETDSGALVPLIRDAVALVDLDARRIEVNREFLGLGAP